MGKSVFPPFDHKGNKYRAEADISDQGYSVRIVDLNGKAVDKTTISADFGTTERFKANGYGEALNEMARIAETIFKQS